jgi:hypothetical protein
LIFIDSFLIQTTEFIKKYTISKKNGLSLWDGPRELLNEISTERLNRGEEESGREGEWWRLNERTKERLSERTIERKND